MVVKNFNLTWLEVIESTLTNGIFRSPRGIPTLETIHRTIQVDMRRPVLTVEARKLSYTFMLAEAHWILSGSDKVAEIEPYNKNIAKFSDDGVTFHGAYGPKIYGQIAGVVKKLMDDPDTRQACINIWRENPMTSKDIPCTMSIVFQIRDGKLHCSVFMRSSDIWLGLPYDVFNFSMLSHWVCALINERSFVALHITPGILSLTAASSHLYETNFTEANKVLNLSPADDSIRSVQNKTPREFYTDSGYLMFRLNELKTEAPDKREVWWK